MSNLIPAKFTMGAFAPDFDPQTKQEFANEIARLLQVAPETDPLPSAPAMVYGGPMPTEDVGIWWPTGAKEPWFWDILYGKYYPGDPRPGSILINTQADGFPTPNWIRCDGTAQLQINYPRLFAAIGHLWANDGTDVTALTGAASFRLPDSNGRFILGAGTGVGLTTRVIGTKGGSEVLVPNNVVAASGDDVTPAAAVLTRTSIMPTWWCSNVFIRFAVMASLSFLNL